jgi:hypothetical protein
MAITITLKDSNIAGVTFVIRDSFSYFDEEKEVTIKTKDSLRFNIRDIDNYRIDLIPFGSSKEITVFEM